MMHLDELAKD